MAKFTSFRDMFDGGGAGQTGDRFEGGGPLSSLGNAFFRPAGYQDRLDMAPIQQQEVVRPQTNPRIPNPPATSQRPQQRPVANPDQKPFSGINPSTAYEKYKFVNPAQDFEAYLGTLSDDQIIGRSPEDLVEEFTNYQKTYDMFVKGLGPEAQNTKPDELYRAFKNQMRSSSLPRN